MLLVNPGLAMELQNAIRQGLLIDLDYAEEIVKRILAEIQDFVDLDNEVASKDDDDDEEDNEEDEDEDKDKDDEDKDKDNRESNSVAEEKHAGGGDEGEDDDEDGSDSPFYPAQYLHPKSNKESTLNADEPKTSSQNPTKEENVQGVRYLYLCI